MAWQENGEWQKKISLLMLSQQKKRDEARGEHGGRGLEKEATPAHENEKQYAEALASIISCREKLKEMQVRANGDGGSSAGLVDHGPNGVDYCSDI